MEKVWYSVLFLILINQVFAIYRDCYFDEIENCNECIRCRGYWCNDPKEDNRCAKELRDNWCNNNQEPIPTKREFNEEGQYFNYKYREKTIYRVSSDDLEITYAYKNVNPKVDVFVNSTQDPDVSLENSTECSNGKCTTTIISDPATSFCARDGKVDEYYNITLTVEGINEKVILKNHVPCACQCSEVVEQKSEMCNKRGNYSCGTCTCEAGWMGQSCEKCDAEHDESMSNKCKRGKYRCGKCVCDGNWSGEFCDKCDDRGDVGESCNPRSPDACSGHGICDCGCICYTDTSLYGSRYFDPNNNCEDLCMAISNNCDQCTFDIKPGKCDDCKFPLYRQPYNASLMAERDHLDRHMWVKCNDTSSIDNCTVQYAAMKSDAGDTYMMFISSCDPTNEAIVGPVSVTVPIVMGLLAVIATVLAVAGYLFYKNRTPALPLNDPMYQNIDAEDCTGENPLYKPPTSSFKNPTYGKW